MNRPKPPVLAAISGAIQAYLLEDEACLAAAAVAQMAPRAAGAPPNLWGLSGRQTAMQMRQLMQRRSLR
jgi:hypothetical protein